MTWTPKEWTTDPREKVGACVQCGQAWLGIPRGTDGLAKCDRCHHVVVFSVEAWERYAAPGKPCPSVLADGWPLKTPEPV
jgi:hypothetical protein